MPVDQFPIFEKTEYSATPVRLCPVQTLLAHRQNTMAVVN